MTHPTLALQIAWEFSVDLPAEDPEALHSEGERLTEELLKLEECNHGDVRDPAVSTEADRNVVLVELVIIASDLPSGIQKALNVVRTAIHATGGSTPDWPTIDELRPAGVAFRIADFHTRPIAVPAAA